MDQKNTIVKCAMHKCLFNHCGTCDQYVITIGVDGSCQEYVETENITIRPVVCEHCGHYEDHGLLQNPCNKHECYRHRKENACVDFISIRGQRAKCNFYEDGWVDSEIVKETCQPFTMSDHLCDIRCVSAHYAEDGKIYCALIQDFPERPLSCSAYDDGGEE